MPDGTLYEVWVCSACMEPVHFRVQWNEWVGNRTCDENCRHEGELARDNDDVRRILFETDAPLQVT